MAEFIRRSAAVVLLPTYAITENIIFNAEIEFEHAGSGFDNDDKLHGTAEIEQVWVDFKFSDPVSWRAPGVDLVPIGYINQHHEPTQFYSVLQAGALQRPDPLDLESAGDQHLRNDRGRHKISSHAQRRQRRRLGDVRQTQPTCAPTTTAHPTNNVGKNMYGFFGEGRRARSDGHDHQL